MARHFSPATPMATTAANRRAQGSIDVHASEIVAASASVVLRAPHILRLVPFSITVHQSTPSSDAVPLQVSLKRHLLATLCRLVGWLMLASYWRLEWPAGGRS